MKFKLLSKYETFGNPKIQLAFGTEESTIMAPGMTPFGQSSITLQLDPAEADVYEVGVLYTLTLTATQGA